MGDKGDRRVKYNSFCNAQLINFREQDHGGDLKRNRNLENRQVWIEDNGFFFEHVAFEGPEGFLGGDTQQVTMFDGGSGKIFGVNINLGFIFAEPVGTEKFCKSADRKGSGKNPGEYSC